MSGQMKFISLVLVSTAIAVAGWYFSFDPAPEARKVEANLNTGTPYDQLAKLPDFSGPWLADHQPSVVETDAALPLTPEFATKIAEARAAFKASGSLPANPLCKPAGLPLYMQLAQPLMDIQYA